MSVVERLARALELWNEHDTIDVPHRAEWSIAWADSQFKITTLQHARPGEVLGFWTVDEPTALLALLAYARGLEVDLGPCPACVKRGGRWESKTIGINGPEWTSILEDDDVGWQRASEPYNSGIGAIPWRLALRRPCQDCSPGLTDITVRDPGRDVRPLVRVLLDSIPKRAKVRSNASDWGNVGAALAGAGHPVFDVPGDPASRNALAVKADELAQAGDPLAGPLAAFLGGECRGCDGTGIRTRPPWEPGQPVDTIVRRMDGSPVRDCTRCVGHGTVLGALLPKLHSMAFNEWHARTQLCSTCRGSGRLFQQIAQDGRTAIPRGGCIDCGGQGWVTKA